MATQDTTKAPASTSPTPAATPVSTAAPTAEQLLGMMQKIQELEAAQAVAKAVPAKTAGTDYVTPQIDWAKVSENDVYSLDFPIPVIEHELPDYMDIHLKSQEYVARWTHKLSRHLGTRLAMGYSYVEPEDWDPNFPLVLQFTEGKLFCEDVVALKIHKSIYFRQLKQNVMKSTQINNVSGYAKVKGQLSQAISQTAGMESAMKRGAMSFYGEQADSNIEEIQ
jgi:hypothetical protein